MVAESSTSRYVRNRVFPTLLYTCSKTKGFVCILFLLKFYAVVEVLDN